MDYTTLISAQDLLPHLEEPGWAILDCRFDLHQPEKGESEYLEAHIPGAVYAHLERDLSAPLTGKNGRHPLPSVENLAGVFSRWGIGPGVQVVAYDADRGQIAARLWWSLRYLGHDQVAVLDGGYKAWKEAGFPSRGGRENRKARQFQPAVRPSLRVEAAEILEHLGRSAHLLLDARAPERYRGDEEPLDPVAGHIPGAVNHSWEWNQDEKGRFLPPEVLRGSFLSLLGGTKPESVVSYCGSGVTACHNLLAMEHAGLRGARLYPGSWSEWCADRARPIETGSSRRTRPE